MPVTNFTERWQQKQRDFGLEEMWDGLVVNDGWVLPASAAPFLSFAELKHMPKVEDVFNLEGWPEAELAKLEPYRMIGSDGAGNPICVEQETAHIWLLDHDAHFQARQFINSSVDQLAESLLAYLGEDKPERVVAAIAAQDPRAMNEGAFWWHEANSLCRGKAQQAHARDVRRRTRVMGGVSAMEEKEAQIPTWVRLQVPLQKRRRPRHGLLEASGSSPLRSYSTLAFPSWPLSAARRDAGSLFPVSAS